jgi:hypothetical protein
VQLPHSNILFQQDVQCLFTPCERGEQRGEQREGGRRENGRKTVEKLYENGRKRVERVTVIYVADRWQMAPYETRVRDNAALHMQAVQR